MTQGTPVRTAEAQAAEAFKKRTEELVGDGTTLDAATFAAFGVDQRMRLFRINPERYRELQAELDKATDLRVLGGGR